jgi:alpha-mannosidase
LAKTKYAYPDEKLDNIWQNLLLNQFHDILPGTAIAWVVDQTVKELNWSCSQLRTLIKDTLNRVDQPFINKVKLTKSARAYELFNDNCRIKIDKLGYISSYEIKTSNNFEQLIPKGQKFAVLQLLDDKPIQWDTWDIDKSAFHAIKEFIKPDKTVVNSNGVTFDFKSDKSLFSLTISLNNQSSGPELDIRVDWAEEEKLLKLALPLDLAANITKAETQYGLIERPVYNNLLADDAKFETSMQRFVFIENNDLQIGVVNNGLYGFDSTPIVGGGTQLRPTILKSSKYPDPRSEKNKYSDFKISLVAGQRNNNNSVLDMILDKANQLNNEFIFDYSQFLEIDNLQGKLVLDWIKLADDKSGDIIARFYEPYGARAKSNIKLSKLLQNYKVKEVDLLETDNLPNDIYKSYKAKNDNILVLETQPFYLVTLRFSK